MNTLNRYIAFGKYGLEIKQGCWYKSAEVDTLLTIQNGKISSLQADIKAKDSRINVLERQVSNLNRTCDKQDKIISFYKKKFKRQLLSIGGLYLLLFSLDILLVLILFSLFGIL